MDADINRQPNGLRPTAQPYMKNPILYLSALTLLVSSAFAAPTTTPVAPVASPTPAQPAMGGVAKAPVAALSAQPGAAVGALPVKGVASAPAPSSPKLPVAPVAGSVLPVSPPPSAVKPAAHRKAHHKKKPNLRHEAPKVVDEEKAPEEHVPTAYEIAVKERAELLEARQRAKAEARWTYVESTGCAFMAPVFEKLIAREGDTIVVQLPDTAEGSPVKVTSAAPWVTAERNAGTFTVAVQANNGDYRKAHVALETPGVFCDVVVNQAGSAR